MSFKKLLEMTDKIAREELGNYYIISEARMNNYLYCLESGAKQVLKLKEDITTLQDQLQAAQALAATHLADQELLVARERKRVAQECASIAREQAQAPPGAWGDGATYNAMKIVRLIKERYEVEE